MLKVGLPILASLMLGFAAASADRLIVAANGEMSLLGLYGFAFSVAGIAGSLAWVIRVVVYTDVYAGVAAQGAGPALRAHLEETVLPLARLVPPALGVVALMLGPAVSLALPSYVDAVPAARLLLFTGVTAGFEQLGVLGVVAAERQKILPVFSGGALLLNATFSILALRSGLGLQGVAAAAVVSNAAFGLAALGLVARLAQPTHPARFLVKAALPFLWCALAVVVIGAARPGLGLSHTLTSLGLYLVAILPLLPGGLIELRKVRRFASLPAHESGNRSETPSKTVPVLMILLLVSVLVVVTALVIVTVDRKFLGLGRRETVRPSAQHTPVTRVVDLRPVPGIQPLPHYVDLDVGDTVSITRADADPLEIRVASIDVENASHSSPRTRVNLQVGRRQFPAYCGMRERRRGGLGPTDIDGVRVGVEVTRLLFSEIKGGSSPFNIYKRLRLQNDLRLTIWDRSQGVMPGADGRFVVSQPAWPRERFGNWLHSTSYGIHSAIDVYATPQGPPEKVRSPVDGTVYRVYNRHAPPDDRRRSKAINIHGDAVVGPHGEKVLYRFFHFSEVFVSDGESVRRGQVIGLTGHTGFDPKIGDHLHFEMRLNPSHFGLPGDDDIFATIPVNPYYYLLEWYESERERRN
jgi:murein DD-endopeptidase MepM/ murein hydrolase activator NlpD